MLKHYVISSFECSCLKDSDEAMEIACGYGVDQATDATVIKGLVKFLCSQQWSANFSWKVLQKNVSCSPICIHL